MLLTHKFQSPNCAPRDQQINYIIVHFTEMLFEDALERLMDKASQVSAHYLIKKDGEILHLVDDSNIAWHAGASSWHGQEKLNQNSIGIELDNMGNEPFSDPQMKSCIELSASLMLKYNIKAENFIGHSDVAPSRKIDPGIFFDWQRCAEHNLGIWYGIKREAGDDEEIMHFGDSSGSVKKLQQQLMGLGYKIEITGVFDEQTNFVVRAFLSKFCPEIIRDRGMEFYKDQDSRYAWDVFSEKMLNKNSKRS